MINLDDKEQVIREYLAGLIEIPLVFEGQSLCPDCLWKAMEVIGGHWWCHHCDTIFPGTIAPDKWGMRWLKMNDMVR